MKYRIITLFVFAFLAKNLSAQIYPVLLSGYLIPPHSLDLSVYATQRSQDLVFNAVLIDPVEPFRDTRLKLYIENNGSPIYITDPNYAFPTLRLNKDQPVILDGFALQPYLQPQALTGATGQGQGSVIVPEGLNRICLEVIDLQRNEPISKKVCVTGNFFLNEPPQLLMPICHNQMPFPPTQSQLFNWTPMHIGSGNNPAPVEYVFKLVELLPGADPNDGFDFNFQILEKTSMTPSLIYSPVDPPLYPGKTYAWRVQARNMLKPGLMFRNNGFSQVCTFTYYGNGGGGGPFGNGYDPSGGGFPGGGGGGGGFPGGGGGGGIGGSTAAEQQEEIRVPPQGCEVFNTDFGPIFSDNYTPAPLVEGDVVGLGYFDMTVSDATASGEGYSGTGYVLIPMLKTKVQVEFTDLKAKPNTLRCYAAEDIRAVGENQFYINPSNLSQATLGANFTQQYFQNLDNFFANGQGTTRKVSQFDPANPTPNLLPICIDKENSPLIAVTGIKFTPRNCYLICAGYSKTPGGQIVRYAGFNLQITPYGAKNGTELTMLDVNGSTSEVADIFTLKITGGTGGSGMSMDCSGFSGYDLDAEISVDPQVMVTAGDSPSGAGGGGVVKIGLSESSSDPATYLGGIDNFSDFTLPTMPGFTFNVNDGQLDLSGSEKINLQTFPNFYQAANSNEWRGLYLGDVQVKLPAEYDFSGQGNQLTLDKGSLFVAGQGAFGSFQKNNLVSLEAGKLGTWRYSVDTMQLGIVGSQTDSTVLAGRIRVPLLDAPFAYHSLLNVNSSFTEMAVKPQPGVRGMSLWGGEIDLNDSTEVKAQLKDVNGQRKFFPSAKLYGKLKIDLDATEFNDKLTGNKAQTVAQLKQMLGIAGEVDFKISDLRLKNFAIDPYAAPNEQYLLQGWGNPPSGGQGGDSVSIGGKNFKIGEVAMLNGLDSASNTPELGLKLIALEHSSLVQFTLWGKASEQGGFVFDRIEVQTENVTCNCTSMLDRGGFDPSSLGMIKEMYYEKHYSPAALGFKPLDEKTGSLASIGGAFGEESIVQKFATGNLDNYKTAVMNYLDEHMVGGFIVEDGVLQLPWGDEISLDLPPADLKLPWQDLVSMNQTGTTYKAEIKINRTDANFTVAGIDAHLSSNENKKLPLDLTSKLQSLGIKGTYPFPANAEARLLLTKFEVTQNTGGTAIGADANVVSEFTLLVKVSNGGQDKHLQFINNTAGRLSATGLGLRDFYLYLDADATYPGTDFKLTFKKSDGNQSETGTYVKIDCDGFRGFNVQAEMTLPGDKVRSRKAPAETPGDKELVVGATITGSSLKNFIASIKATGPDGQPFNFVVPGAEALVFEFGESFAAYLDMDSQGNPSGFPTNSTGADGSFRGLFLKQLQFRVEGFTVGTANSAMKVNCEKFLIGTGGVEGKVTASDVISATSSSSMGGWAYTLDNISFEFKGSSLTGSAGIALDGRIKMPVLKGDFWLKYNGTLGFDKSNGKYQPVGDLKISTEEFSKAFEFDGIGGLRVQFTEGTGIGVRYEPAAGTPAAGQPRGKFTPYATLNGNAAVFLGSNIKEQLGFDPGMDFEYELISFQGFEINPPSGSTTGTGTSIQGGTSGGVSSARTGVWGKRASGSNIGSLRSPQGAAGASGATAGTQTSTGGKGLQGFPLVINSIGFDAGQGGMFSMKLDFTVNLSKGSSSSSGGNASGLSATTKLAVNFKLENGKFSNANVSPKVALEEFSVDGKFGPVGFKGALKIIKNDPVFGNGFKAKVDIDFKAAAFKGVAQFGTTTSGKLSSNTGDFRYFFIDLEGTSETGIVIVPPPVVVRLHGVGGGFFYNMEKEIAVTKENLNVVQEPTNIMDPGVSLSGFKYKPAEGKLGGYLSAIASVMDPKVLLGDVAIGAEMNYQTFGFTKIFVKGAVYQSALSVSERKEKNLANLSAEIDMDIVNWRLSGTLGYTLDRFLTPPSPPLRIYSVEKPGSTQKAPFNVNFLIDFKDKKWYVKAGRPLPNKYMTANLDMLGFNLGTIEAYLQAGFDVDPMPQIKDLVPDWTQSGEAGSRLASSLYQSGNGIGFGMKFTIPKKEYQFANFYASINAGAGFDMSMIKMENRTCEGKPIGFDGWWMQGQAFAYLRGNMGMNYDIGVKKGKISIFDINAAAVLQAKFPNPSMFQGQIKGSFSVLNGALKGNVNFKLDMTTDKDRACLNEIASQGAAPVAGMTVVADVFPPKGGADKQQVFVEPKLAYNLALGGILSFEDVDDNDNKTWWEYRPSLEYFRLKQGGAIVSGAIVNTDAHSSTFKPDGLLKPKTQYTLEYKVKWQQKVNGNWSDVANGAETGSVNFTTAEFPSTIVAEALDNQAPGNKQRYWHKGYANPRLALKPANWSSLFPASIKKTIGGKEVTITFDYIARLTEFDPKSGAQTKQVDFPLSDYPGAITVEVPVRSTKTIGDRFIIPTVTMQQQSGTNVGYADLDKYINLEKLYKLNIIRLPVLPTADVSETQSAQGSGENTYTVATRKLAGAADNVVAGELKILYEGYFATSQFNNLNDKLSSVTIKWVASSLVRKNDIGHPEDAKMTKVTNTYANNVKDDYYIFQPYGREGFDKYDLDRIRLNMSAPGYLTPWGPYNDFYSRDFRKMCRDAGSTGGNAASTITEVFSGGDKDGIYAYLDVVMEKYYNVPDWHYHFNLNDNAYDQLTASEITNKKLVPHYNTGEYKGKKVKEGAVQDIFLSDENFSMVYHDVRSRIVAHQLKYLDWVSKKVSEGNWKLYTEGGYQAFEGENVNNSLNLDSDSYGVNYRGKILLEFPKLSKWNDMRQKISNTAQYPSQMITLPERAKDGTGPGTAASSYSVVATQTSDELINFSADYSFLNDYPVDKKFDFLAVVGQDDITRIFWDGERQEADLFYRENSTWKRAIMYDKVFPPPGSWLIDYFKPSGVKDETDGTKNSNDYVQYDQKRFFNNTKQDYNSINSYFQRPKLLRFRRDMGSNPLMLLKDEIGNGKEPSDGSTWRYLAMFIEDDKGRPVFYQTKNGARTLYTYTNKGYFTSPSTLPSNALFEMKPGTVYKTNILLSQNNSGKTHVIDLNNNIWDQKYGVSVFPAFNNGCAEHIFETAPTVLNKPYSGTAIAIPGKIEAENFDKGGPSIGYYDTDDANQGNYYRTSEGVDIARNNTGNCTSVGWNGPGEWTDYSINVANTKPYNIDIRYAAQDADGKVRLWLDGKDISGEFTLPKTGLWDTYQIATLTNKNLPAGNHILRLEIISTAALDYINIKEAVFAQVKVTEGNAAISSGSELTNIDFGNQRINTSQTKSLKIWNTANTGAPNLTVTLPAIPAGYKVTMNPLSGIIPPQSSATLTVEFTPTAVQGYNQTLGLTLGGAETVTPQNISLTGKGLLPATVKVTAGNASNSTDPALSSLDFGSQSGCNCQTKTLKIWNTAASGASELTVTLPATPAGFSISLGAAGGIIPAGQSALLTVAFLPGPSSQNYNPPAYVLSFAGTNPATTQSIILKGSVTATTGTANSCYGVSIAATDMSCTANDGKVLTGGSAKQTATGTGGGGNFTYSWSNSLGAGAEKTVNPTQTTTYTVTATDANGCTATATNMVTVFTTPTVSIAATDASCTANDGKVLTGGSAKLMVSGTGGGGGFTYSWSNSLGTGAEKTVNPTQTTTYTVTATDANGCTATATNMVMVFTTPTVSIAATDASCTANDGKVLTGGSAKLMVSGTGGGGGFTYSWSNSLGTGAEKTVNPTQTTTYTVTATDANGCAVVQSQTVTVIGMPSVGYQGYTTLCPGQSTTLTASGMQGSSPYTYRWSPATGLSATDIASPVVSPTTTTTYTITVTDASGCTATTSVTMTTSSNLSATITGASAICQGQSITLTPSGTGGLGGYTYIWGDGYGNWVNNSASYTDNPYNTKTYYLKVTDSKGCTATTSKTVTVNEYPSVNITPNEPLEICRGGSTTLSANATGGTGTYSYSWSPSTGLSATNIASPVASPAANTTYTVAVTASGCPRTASRTVAVSPLLTLNASTTSTICQGEPTTLTAVVNGGSHPYRYSWSPSTGLSATNIENPVASPTANTTYTVTVTDSKGCTATRSQTLGVRSYNPSVSGATTICLGQSTTLTATPYATAYAWSTGATTAAITVSPIATTIYTVTITGESSCTSRISKTVTVNPVPTVGLTKSGDLTGSATSSTLTALKYENTSYFWSAGAYQDYAVGDNIANVFDSGTYTVTVTNNYYGCPATESITVNAPGIQLLYNDKDIPYASSTLKEVNRGDSPVTLSYTIKNTGTAPLAVSSVSSSSSVFTVSPLNTTIPPGNTATLSISFTPNFTWGYKETVITVKSDALTNSTFDFRLKAKGKR